MFSTLSYHWNLILGGLFPSLKEKEDLSETTEMRRRLIILVELIRLKNLFRGIEDMSDIQKKIGVRLLELL